MPRYLIVTVLSILSLLPDVGVAQTASLRGFITDAADGHSLEFVNVALRSDAGTITGSVSNRDGLYLIPNLKPGTYALEASFIGYGTFSDSLVFAPGDRRVENIRLSLGDATLDEVLVEARRASGPARITAGQQTVRPRDIELIPAPDLSGDLANLLTSLPGVVSLGDRGGQLFIRGGEPSQNLVQIDGILLYQPFHILGFYSAFPSDLLNRTDIYAGGFGSKFGERISSVIDISTRSGNTQRFNSALTLSPFVSGLRVEGPLITDRISVLASIRQSLVENGADRLVKQPLPFNFGDVFAKIHGVLSPSSRLSAMFIQTHDRGSLGKGRNGGQPDEVRWNNVGAGLRFLSLPSVSPIMFDGNVSFSRLPTRFGPRNAPNRSSTIQNFNVSANVTFFGKNVDTDAGVSFRIIKLKSRLGGLFQNIDVRSDRIVHAAVYLEPEYNVGGGLRIRPGARIQFFDVRFEPFFEPRLRITWSLGAHEISAAAGVYDQAILGLNDRRDAASVFTVWTNIPREAAGSTDIRAGKAQRAIHTLLGYRVSPTKGMSISVEGYYKHLSNLFLAEWTAFPRFTTRLQPGTGRSFGLDLRLELRNRAFYGYVTYGYSNTRYTAEQASLRVWFGTPTLDFSPPHDRRHQVNALISRSFGAFKFSARWEFGSGLPFTQAVGFDGFALINDVTPAIDVPGSRRVIYGQPFNARLPTYHRLDLSAERAFHLKAAKLTIQGSLINLYDRSNIFFLDVFTLRQTDQLPLLPSLGLKLEMN